MTVRRSVRRCGPAVTRERRARNAPVLVLTIVWSKSQNTTSDAAIRAAGAVQAATRRRSSPARRRARAASAPNRTVSPQEVHDATVNNGVTERCNLFSERASRGDRGVPPEQRLL